MWSRGGVLKWCIEFVRVSRRIFDWVGGFGGYVRYAVWCWYLILGCGVFSWCVVLLVRGGLCDNDGYGYIGRFRWSHVRGCGEYWCRSVVKLIGVRFGWILVVIVDSWGWYYDVE